MTLLGNNILMLLQLLVNWKMKSLNLVIFDLKKDFFTQRDRATPGDSLNSLLHVIIIYPDHSLIYTKNTLSLLC